MAPVVAPVVDAEVLVEVDVDVDVEVAAACVPVVVVVPPAPPPPKAQTPIDEQDWSAGQAWHSAPSTPQLKAEGALHTPAASQQPEQLVASHLFPHPAPSPRNSPTSGKASQKSRVFMVVSAPRTAARQGIERTIA